MSSPAPEVPTDARAAHSLDLAILIATMLAAALLRWHTMDEPLDCDEAAYGYVAHRILAGDRLYVDVFENKPPLAYAPYAAAIVVGGYTERAIRWLPVPFVLLTQLFLWRVAREHGGRVAAAVAATLIAIASTDPYTFGNGANLELYMNACLAVSLYGVSRAATGARVRWALAAGVAVGCAVAIKQVAVLHLAQFGAWLWLCVSADGGRVRQLKVFAALVGGAVIPWLGCVAFAAAQGVLSEFVNTVFVYAPVLSREASEEMHSSFALAEITRLQSTSPTLAKLLRDQPALLSVWWFFKGNPQANAWWGTSMWPLLALAGWSVACLLRSRPRRIPALLVGYAMVSCLAIFWPGLFWQHYYMLLVPPVVLLAALGTQRWLDTARRGIAEGDRLRAARGTAATLVAAGLFVVCAATLWSDYLCVSPAEITSRYKGGRQWVSIRELGGQIRRAAPGGERLFNWGWQSPLHVYSGLDSVTPYFFTDPLLQRYDVSEHPLTSPRKARIMADLRRTPPAFVFVGQRPFPELVEFLRRGYVHQALPESASDPRGLYLRGDLYDRAKGRLSPP